MLLSDKDLLDALGGGRLQVDPFDPDLIQPASIDLRLDRYFAIFSNHHDAAIDPREDQSCLTEKVEVDDGRPLVLHPGEFVLGSTLEQITVCDLLAARIEGKSSLGRLGLLTHSTAGFVDPGFRGHITLELANVANLPIKLWPGMKIGQMCVFQLSSPSRQPYGHQVYGSHYQMQSRGPAPSRGHLNFRTWPTRTEESPCA